MTTTRLAAAALAAAVLASVPAMASAANGPKPHDPKPHQSVPAPKAGPRAMPHPLVIAHRGASGYRPEHTLAAYELAVAMGADYIEPDLVMTKDGVPVDRHEPEISGTTDVADHPEFAARKTTKMLDGVATTGWFTEDFTLAELKTLRAKERLPELRQQNTVYDGRWEVPTYEEVLQLRAELSKKYKREIGIIPEIKHSTYFKDAGLPAERAVVDLTTEYKLNKKNAPMWIQSFELSNLIELREKLGYKANLVFLTTVKGGPYDLEAKGDPRTYADLTTPESLRELRQWIDGISPEKAALIPRTATGELGQPTPLIKDAHAAGLQVATWTFRAENSFLPPAYRIGTDPADYGRMMDEVRRYYDAGVDSVFCDNPDLCVEARKDFLGEQG
ncbi:glycerophosphodiester phosphodiesterase [Actinomycetota bacterium]